MLATSTIPRVFVFLLPRKRMISPRTTAKINPVSLGLHTLKIYKKTLLTFDRAR
jgi:hypothetical protein